MEADALEQYVPHYLTQEQKSGLQNALRAFPEKANYHNGHPENGPLQGDCFNYVPIRSVINGEFSEVDCLVLSNTCDVDLSNRRIYPAHIVLAPLIPLDSFRAVLLKKGVSPKVVEAHESAIRKQAITNIFFLPRGGNLSGDQIVRFDHCFSLPLHAFSDAMKKGKRLASLSMLGFYILTFKLSVHFCRMHEDVNRSI